MTTITTEAQLADLPDGSVVLDRDGDVSQLRDGRWCSYETMPMSDHGLAKHLPATLLVPEKARYDVFDPLAKPNMRAVAAESRVRELEREAASLRTKVETVRGAFDTWQAPAGMSIMRWMDKKILEVRAILDEPLPPRPAVTHEQIEAFVQAVTPMATNETHAWNLWNHLASDQGDIREALTTVWAQYPDRVDQEEADRG